MNIKWTDKYQPNSINDICGYDNEIKVIKNWIENFSDYKSANKSLFFIQSNCGFGKSTIAELLLHEFGYNIIYISDDDMDELDISYKLEKAIQYRNIFDMFKGADCNKTAVLIDDIDKIASRGNTKIISRFFNLLEVKKSNIKITVPILCTFTKTTKTITRIKKANSGIKLNLRKELDIIKIIKKIVNTENINCSIKVYKKLTKECKGDIRMLLNMIENIKDSIAVSVNDMKLKNKTENKNKNKNKNKTETENKNKNKNKTETENKNKTETENKKIKNKDIIGIINNYKKRNFDNDLFESMNSIYTLNINSNENKEKIIMLIQNDQFLIPYLIYENTIPVIFNQYKNKVTKNNSEILQKINNCYNVFDECNQYWNKIYTEHEHDFSDILNYISGIGINSCINDNLHNLHNNSKSNLVCDYEEDETKKNIININYNYSMILNKTSLLQKRKKKYRMSSSTVNQLNISSENIKLISECLYRYIEFKDYKSVANIIKEYNIPYKEITSKNKTKYILSSVLSDMFSVLVSKTKNITKKIETDIIRYLD